MTEQVGKNIIGEKYRRINGIRQLQKYNKALGGGFKLRLELY